MNIRALPSISIPRQKWFYFLLGTLSGRPRRYRDRGVDHFSAFGVFYPVRQGVLFALSIAAIFIADRRYHGAFALLAIAAEIYWIVSQFEVLE